ncbi:MAG: HPP family protein [Halobacteriales archaeon]|nr:HPP family protein [Halobacteriales archaeon]
MFEGWWTRYRAIRRRLRRFERREVEEFRRWIEHTNNLIHLSVLLFVPLLIGVVTALSNAIEAISFLLFPPLASGTYTLFADPEGRYASPKRFVAGLTIGAFCGWIALEAASLYIYHVPPAQFNVSAGGAAIGVLLTGIVTWVLDIEEPSAYSTALLVLVTGTSQLLYVISVAISSTIVAGAFSLWRGRFYEQRAKYLYHSTQADDHVLVPIRGNHEPTTAFAAQLASAHEAGKVVLLDLVAGEDLKKAKVSALNGTGPDATDGEPAAAQDAAERLEEIAERVQAQYDIPCEVIVAVAGANAGRTVLDAAHEAGCDLIVTPYEERYGGLTPFVKTLFRSDIDVVALRANSGRENWRRIMIPVRRAGDTAHTMLEFATRLAGEAGAIAVCHCISDPNQRRSAETMLANLVETFEGVFETRVANTDIETFLDRNAEAYDLTIIGASTDRIAASRFLAPPTFERISDIEADIAIVHRGEAIDRRR